MTRILVVDDEPAIVKVIRDRLEREGFQVHAVASGEEALSVVEALPPDGIVLDVMLPGIDGFEVLRRLRHTGQTVPVIVLTARDEDVDVIVGLEMGADDYLIKPFNPRELSARIRAVLRRQTMAREKAVALGSATAPGAAMLPDTATIDHTFQAQGGPPAAERAASGLSFDLPRRRAWFRGQILELRPREYDLLYFLARHRGQVFSRQALLSHVWGYDSDIDERTVDVHVRRLRAKLAAIAPEAEVILTEWGIGYRLAEDVE